VQSAKSPHPGACEPRNEAECGYSNWTSVNGRPLTNTRCVSDSGALTARSSHNFGAIESHLRNILRVRGRKVRGRHCQRSGRSGFWIGRAKHTLILPADPATPGMAAQDRRPFTTPLCRNAYCIACDFFHLRKSLNSSCCSRVLSGLGWAEDSTSAFDPCHAGNAPGARAPRCQHFWFVSRFVR
jgi:hypothetical protein